MREGHLYSTRVQDELSDVDQNQFWFIDQNKFEYSLLATGSKFYEAPILFNSSLSNIWPGFVTPRVVTSGVTHLSLCIRCVTQSREPNKEVFNNTPTGYFRLEL